MNKKLMKNIKMCLGILLFILLCNISNVYAQDIFKYAWESEKVEDSYYYSTRDSIAYGTGFVVSYVSADGQYSYIISYDRDGNILDSITLNNNIVYDLSTYNDKIYVIVYNENNKIELLELDENLKEQNSIELTNVTLSDAYSLLYSSIYGLDEVTFDNDNIYIYIDDIVKVSLDFKNEELILEDDANLEKFFPGIYKLNSLQEDNLDIYYSSYDFKDEYGVYAGDKSECIISEAAYKPSCSYDYTGILRLEKDGELVFEKEYIDYIFIFNARIVSDYIVAVLEDEDYEYSIGILDLDGNILQIIDESEEYFGIVGNDSKFIASSVLNVENSCNVKSSLGIEEAIQLCKISGDVNSIVYYIPYKVETKTDGHGTITASTLTAASGNLVAFTVIPEKGYVLGSVKVTDSNGNVVTFTSNTFTMPSADVVIEATFVVENPNTRDIAIIGAIVLGIVGIMVFVRYKKKLNYLK